MIFNSLSIQHTPNNGSELIRHSSTEVIIVIGKVIAIVIALIVAEYILSI